MDILADENIDAPLVAWLQEQGHDVRWIAEARPAIEDERVVYEARESGRLLLTADLDFGERIFRRGETVKGVILLRLRTASPDELLQRFQRAWEQVQHKAHGHFVVVSNERIRVRALPAAGDE